MWHLNLLTSLWAPRQEKCDPSSHLMCVSTLFFALTQFLSFFNVPCLANNRTIPPFQAASLRRLSVKTWIRKKSTGARGSNLWCEKGAHWTEVLVIQAVCACVRACTLFLSVWSHRNRKCWPLCLLLCFVSHHLDQAIMTRSFHTFLPLVLHSPAKHADRQESMARFC